MEKKTKQKILLYILTVLTAAVLLLLFSNTTSPLFPNNYGVDSAFNRFMGLMIRRGKTLYSEIWDNKGPLLFFIQAIGTLKGTHNADVTLTFLMQIAASLATIFFLYRADRKVHPGSRNPLRLLFPLLCAAPVLAYVLDSGNLSEEWSLPMIGCGLYLLASYAARVRDQPLHPRRDAFRHGV
ncbi:MAG: hypothetical protein IKP86_14330, partial [Anaerolineaceae bacterium]|nr:hypothetical protein [Anaerolineaceae bacterium]